MRTESLSKTADATEAEVAAISLAATAMRWATFTLVTTLASLSDRVEVFHWRVHSHSRRGRSAAPAAATNSVCDDCCLGDTTAATGEDAVAEEALANVPVAEMLCGGGEGIDAGGEVETDDGALRACFF